MCVPVCLNKGLVEWIWSESSRYFPQDWFGQTTDTQSNSKDDIGSQLYSSLLAVSSEACKHALEKSSLFGKGQFNLLVTYSSWFYWVHSNSARIEAQGEAGLCWSLIPWKLDMTAQSLFLHYIHEMLQNIQGIKEFKKLKRLVFISTAQSHSHWSRAMSVCTQ